MSVTYLYKVVDRRGAQYHMLLNISFHKRYIVGTLRTLLIIIEQEHAKRA